MTKIYIRVLLVLILITAKVAASDYTFDQEGNIRFGWSLKDEVGTYTVSGTRIYGQVKQVDANAHHALLSLNGWSTVKNTDYYAYAPYNTRYVSEGHKITALPISYLGQRQSANDDAGHLDAYDFMMARYTTGDSTAEVALNHVGCVVRIEWLPEHGGRFVSMTLSADEPLFAVEAKMNLPEGVVVTTRFENNFTLDLDSIETQDGEPLTAYILLPPMDITDKVIKARLTSADSVEYVEEIMGTVLLAGHSYPVSLGKEYSGDRNLAGSANDSAPALLSALNTPLVTTTDFLYDQEHPLKQKEPVTEPTDPSEPTDPTEPTDPEDPDPPIETAINEVAAAKDWNASNAKVFSIYGARLKGTQRKGLFIINGKKYFR